MESNAAPNEIGKPGENRRFMVNGQYVKDLSFENPNAPASLFSPSEKPKIDLSIDLKARKLQKDKEVYELMMHVSATATAEDKILFQVELAYGGVFTLLNVPQAEAQECMLVDCPHTLYPFARRVIADAVRDGGFPPLMLEPVDFKSLYHQRMKEAGDATENKGEKKALKANGSTKG